MKLTPECDVAIVCTGYGISIYFSKIPDREVASEIYSLHDENGITIDPTAQLSPGLNVVASSISKPDRQRLYYWLDIPPVFSTLEVGKQLASCFRSEHGLTVKLCDDSPGSNLREGVPVGKI